MQNFAVQKGYFDSNTSTVCVYHKLAQSMQSLHRSQTIYELTIYNAVIVIQKAL